MTESGVGEREKDHFWDQFLTVYDCVAANLKSLAHTPIVVSEVPLHKNILVYTAEVQKVVPR